MGEISWLSSFKTVGGIKSGPVALCGFKLASNFWMPADRQGGATLARFGQTAGPSLIKFGTREGGREGGEGGEGRGGEGRGGEGRGGEGRGGQGRGGEGSEGRGGEGRGGEGRGGEGTVHTFHKPEPL